MNDDLTDGNAGTRPGDGDTSVSAIPLRSRAQTSPGPAAAVGAAAARPLLRGNERGKGMLRLLHINAVGAEQLPSVAAAVPPHCVSIVGQLARQYARMWQEFAGELDGRARIIDPSAAIR